MQHHTQHFTRRCGALLGCAAMILWPASVATAQQTVTDQGMADAVENEIIFDQAVDLANVNVMADDGTVTLRGEVDDMLAKRRAERLAQTVRGVTEVNNQLRVAPAGTLTDAEIETGIENALLLDPATDAYEIDANVNDGAVELVGAVTSWREKQLAEKLAAAQAGVRSIDNNISLHYENIRSDSDIQTEIDRALHWSTVVDDELIDVAVTDGKVTLTGIVGSAAEKQRATTLAWAPGVTQVDASGLSVEQWARESELLADKYTAPRTDADIREAVEEALLLEPRVLSTGVTTQVDDGTVTLRGTVGSLMARRNAALAARQVVGVDHVRNRIRVRRDSADTDAALATRIRSALANDVIAEAHEVTVNVTNAKATLRGRVDSWYEKAHIDDVASRIPGVVAVNNYLTVDFTHDPLINDPYGDADWHVEDYDWYAYTPAATGKSDIAIHADIRDELWWSPYVDSEEVNVVVANGTATLTGEVDSWNERQAAVENAYEGGASMVVNELTIAD